MGARRWVPMLWLSPLADDALAFGDPADPASCCWVGRRGRSGGTREVKSVHMSVTELEIGSKCLVYGLKDLQSTVHL